MNGRRNARVQRGNGDDAHAVLGRKLLRIELEGLNTLADLNGGGHLPALDRQDAPRAVKRRIGGNRALIHAVLRRLHIFPKRTRLEHQRAVVPLVLLDRICRHSHFLIQRRQGYCEHMSALGVLAIGTPRLHRRGCGFLRRSGEQIAVPGAAHGQCGRHFPVLHLKHALHHAKHARAGGHADRIEPVRRNIRRGLCECRRAQRKRDA